MATTEELYALLETRFALPEWALWRQVCEAGFGGKRLADAVAMNLFPSRGMEVHGLEIKASRSDWLRELKNPAKADELSRFCDRWWLVVADRAMVKEGELPPTWGLLAPSGKALRAWVDAPKLENVEPLSRRFIAVILRRSMADGRFSWDSQIAAEVRKERERLAKEHSDDLERAVAPLRKFEEAAGLKLDDYDWATLTPAAVGRALRLYLDGKVETDKAEARMRRQLDGMRHLVAQLEELLGPEAREDAA